MVLFKYKEIRQMFKAQEFTFHYGPIQIGFSYCEMSIGSEFTFHYGPIQIICIFYHIVNC